MKPPIPVNEPLLNGNEKKYVTECIESGWISSEGPFVRKFEASMADYANRKHGVAVCNGTAALELAVAALDLPPGSEVLVPSFTIISCVLAIVRRGCVPVLVDSDPVTWNMDAAQLESKITPRTKAVMIVHIYGLPTDVDPVLEIAGRYGLKVIEDASEMIGQYYKDRPCGSFGDISTFSFYANKHVTTGEGGMVLTDDDALAERCSLLRNLFFVPNRRYVHDELGFNFRMTNLQAAIGLAQIERLSELTERKREIGRHYTELLSDLPELQLPLTSAPYADNVYWVYGIVLHEEANLDAPELQARLVDEGIATRPFFWPMHEQPVFVRAGLFRGESYPVAERLARRGFYIPSGMALTAEQRIRVAETLRSAIRA
ncbi:DegT/DnrJ/EryC1/StrS family aminotransferase [Paenibacillus humicola]|uniref:DegT/DnrJ/EryC1/StrS family aminotransferase n=1 Tax=Paenibacillus humicola TaxID=3110540 RepID=UPI00237C3D3E|nr:DegT/DnrJ/EryC1/StrS family aminotransferase [Paenibacillus humicola]